MRLFTPGPVPVPQKIMDASCVPIIHHHSSSFRSLYRDVQENLQQILATSGHVLLMAGSAMTGIDAITLGVLRQDDVVLVLEHGRFGARLAVCSEIAGAKVRRLTVSWGETISPTDVRDVLGELLQEAPVRAVWMVHSETSTGVSLDLEQIAHTIREISPETFILVDAVTSVGIQQLYMDSWGLDAVVAGIQKGLMCPPGLAVIALSDRLEHHIRSKPSRAYANDLLRGLQALDQGLMLWTPPVSLVQALNTATSMILDEGLPMVWQRHDALCMSVRTEACARGWSLVGLGTSRALVVVTHPDVGQIRAVLRDSHNMLVADGQDQWAGRVMRIGICGSYTMQDVADLFTAIDLVTATPQEQR